MIKRWIALVFAMMIALSLAACTKSGTAPEVLKTYEKTPDAKIEAYTTASTTVTTVTYYEMCDGTWKTDDHTYQYRLERTDMLPNSETKCTYVVLSNTADLTFDEVWKASGFSSDLNDYLKPEVARIVGFCIYA